jgi:hypothetical protein
MSSTNTIAALALTSLRSAFHDLTAARNQVLHAQQDLAGARATRTAQLPTKHKGQSPRESTLATPTTTAYFASSTNR